MIITYIKGYQINGAYTSLKNSPFSLNPQKKKKKKIITFYDMAINLTSELLTCLGCRYWIILLLFNWHIPWRRATYAQYHLCSHLNNHQFPSRQIDAVRVKKGETVHRLTGRKTSPCKNPRRTSARYIWK